MGNFYKKISMTLLTLCIVSVSFEALAGMRDKTLSDVMHDIMLTKDATWLKANLGEPDEVDTKYPGYLVWRWKSQYKVKSQPLTCLQAFALNASDKRLVGWQTNCNRTAGSRKIYGEIDESIPIPNPVIPAKLPRYKNKIELKMRLLRKQQGQDQVILRIG